MLVKVPAFLPCNLTSPGPATCPAIHPGSKSKRGPLLALCHQWLSFNWPLRVLEQSAGTSHCEHDDGIPMFWVCLRSTGAEPRSTPFGCGEDRVQGHFTDSFRSTSTRTRPTKLATPTCYERTYTAQKAIVNPKQKQKDGDKKVRATSHQIWNFVTQIYLQSSPF